MPNSTRSAAVRSSAEMETLDSPLPSPSRHVKSKAKKMGRNFIIPPIDVDGLKVKKNDGDIL
eukprot:CAMPEP_0170511976 /NCGR_PEP_ID=MMETSP0208-20121228/66598_1 /TAXON_ID=197538 /ORGANISM="Strombidium inclinatum, Strain S3" /LENGTH=61 /DNA_ID=CAMNT_0010795561 /DNA_START=538 /DNA_END=723 /DNA_ORIENTATION=+